jgi:hypothetical protein
VKEFTLPALECRSRGNQREGKGREGAAEGSIKNCHPERSAAISIFTKRENNEIALKNEPTGSRLEYRVKAINKAGQSKSSNTIAVVL